MRGHSRFHGKHRELRSPEERFELQVVRREGCWGWIGTVNNKGYPVLNVKRENGKWVPMIATRVAYALAYGVSPGELEVCHKCDNPECTNPGHLFLATHKENFKDMTMKGRAGVGTAKITFEIAQQIRSEYTGERGNQRRLAEKYGVSHSSISGIVNMKKWIRPQGLAAVQDAERRSRTA